MPLEEAIQQYMCNVISTFGKKIESEELERDILKS